MEIEHMTNIASPPRLAVYARVSTDRQERENTIESQISETFEYIGKNYPDVNREDVIIYRDNGWSGTTLERPAMDQMRIELREDRWSELIVYDPDRIARDPYLQMLILEELEKNGKKIHFCTVPVPKDDESKLLFEMRGILAKYERIRNNGRFRIGKLRKARDKKILLSVPPYGYNLNTKTTDSITGAVTDTHLTIHPDEAKVVRLIFQWLGNDGITLRQIVKRLDDLGIKPRNSIRGVWSTSTLGSLVRNKTYIGLAKYRTTEAIEPVRKHKNTVGPIRNKKTSRRQRPKEEWIEIPVPAILSSAEDERLFMRAQEQLISNRVRHDRTRKNNYLLAGKVKCACGSSRCGEGPKKGKYLYYRCSARGRSYPLPKACPHQAINARVADDMVWHAIAELLGSRELLQEQLTSLLKNVTTSPNPDNDSFQELSQKLEKIHRKIAKLQHGYLENSFSDAEFKQLNTELRQEKEYLESKLHDLKAVKQTVNNDILTPEEIPLLVEAAQEALNDLSFEQKRGIVLRLIDTVEAIPGSITVSGCIPIGSFNSGESNVTSNYYSFNQGKNHVEHKTISRNCRTSKCR